MTPTQMAELQFEDALTHLRRVDDAHLSLALQNLVMGLQSLATGVRATYQAVDRTQRALDALEKRSRDPRF